MALDTALSGEHHRPRAEDFLELVERAKRGRLKIYLGFAAGVGKTYRMLDETHALVKRGVDVVVAFVETHGRAETAAMIEGLELVPRRRIEYRGVVVEEMDLAAVLARRPQLAIVDEIAHTNVPGSKNRKRYQDVLELLDAGINVMCAFNIQHLESLKDLVERVARVPIRETIPDTFLKQADQVVTLDLSVEDLLERLRSGKIYAPDKVPSAMANFFNPGNLASLRELALREVAESLERAASRPIVSGEQRSAQAASSRVMVCVASLSPRAASLLRRGSRMAGRLNTDWYVVYVQTPSESPLEIDATAQRHLHETIEMARDLGAQVVKLEGGDPVSILLDYASANRVAHIILGRSDQPWYRKLLRRDFMTRLIDGASEFDVHVISLAEPEAGE